MAWIFTAIAWCAAVVFGYSQTLNAPTPADNPNLPGNSAWTAACASQDFNEYFVNFTWAPPLVGATNEFILELSDETGSFDTTTELARVSDKNTTFDFNFQFALPQTAQGDNYRMRVRSTNPELTSPPSNAYPMYFIGYKDPILISQDGNGVIPPAGTLSYCTGNTLTLATHSVPNPETYKYNWYRDGALLGEKSNSIILSQEGTYQVEIDYGSTCSGSANTLSNTIVVTESSATGVSITPPAQTEICPGNSAVLNAVPAQADLIYTWYRDGVEIAAPEAGNFSLEVFASDPDFPGDYTVNISGNNVCSETSAPVTLTVPSVPTAEISATSTLILPGGSVELSVTTSASNPTFQWFLDNSPIAGATSSTYTATTPGVYSVEVSDGAIPCPDSSIRSADFELSTPASFELTIGTDSGYLPCESGSATLSVEAIIGRDAGGNATDFTSELLSSFSWQWFDGNGPLVGETGTSLSLGSGDSGAYHLNGSQGPLILVSNVLDILINNHPNVAVDIPRTALCDESDRISLSLSDPQAGDTYLWLKDGSATGETDSSIEVAAAGNYVLQRTREGCTSSSASIAILNFDASAIALDPAGPLYIPRGESQEVTASGALSYEWIDPSGASFSTNATTAVSQEGTYTVIASSGTCEVTLTLEVFLRDTFPIPNVISPNGDGINDRWIVPNTYSFRSDVTIRLYDRFGQLLEEVSDYQNDWPAAGFFNQPGNTLVYYVIDSPEEGMLKGTITVIP